MSEPERPSRVVASHDGAPIALFSSGSGSPVVLVHGASADHTTFRVVGPRLAQRFTVHAMDRRGRGASGDVAPYAIEREFEDVAAVADAVAADAGTPVAVVGHSFGGRVALGGALRTDAIRAVAEEYLRGGRHLRYPDVAHNNLLVSIANAFGIATSSFGLPEYSSGPLPGLFG